MPFTKLSGVRIDTLAPNNYDYEIEYGEYNGSRVSRYSRIDLALMYTHKFSWGKTTLNVSAINVLNHQNVINRYYDLLVSDRAKMGLEEPQLIVKERKGLPFTPNISVGVEFAFPSLAQPQIHDPTLN